MFPTWILEEIKANMIFRKPGVIRSGLGPYQHVINLCVAMKDTACKTLTIAFLDVKKTMITLTAKDHSPIKNITTGYQGYRFVNRPV